MLLWNTPVPVKLHDAMVKLIIPARHHGGDEKGVNIDLLLAQNKKLGGQFILRET